MQRSLLIICLFLFNHIVNAQGREIALVSKINGQERGLKLSRLDTEVEILGRLAETTMTMTFFNGSQQTLEGTLYFPLPEDSTVSSYALDVNGRMLESVAVPKAKARKVFNKIVRQGIDPGLVEWVKGNTFKTRVFPILKKSTRTIRVSYISELSALNDTLRVPLNLKKKVDEFSIKIAVLDSETEPLATVTESGGLKFKKWQKRWQTEASFQNQEFNKDIVVKIPNLSQRKTFLAKASNGLTYFLIHGPKLPQMTSKLDSPTSITIAWDSSLSRDYNHEVALDLLRAYLKTLDTTTKIRLIIFSNRVHSEQNYSIDQVEKLLQDIKSTSYDGATNFHALAQALNKMNTSQNLIFSDGLNNWSNQKIQINSPSHTFAMASKLDPAFLKSISLKSAGQFFNLKKLKPVDILNRLQYQSTRFLVAKSTGNSSELYPSIASSEYSTEHSQVGILNEKDDLITLSYGVDRPKVHPSFIIKQSDAVESELLRRFWAQKKLAELLLDEEENEARISSLGLEHNIVTPFTSLLVLESLEQYLEHKIRPPSSEGKWRMAYDKAMAHKKILVEEKEMRNIEELITKWQQRVAWYNKDFQYPKGFKYSTSKKTKMERDDSFGGDTAVEEVSDGSDSSDDFGGDDEFEGDAAPSVAEEMSVDSSDDFEDDFEEESEDVVELGFIDGAPMGVKKKLSKSSKNTASIKIKEWDPKTPYIVEMKKDPKQAYQVYLKFRKDYKSSPAFYFDCANFFFKNQDKLNAEKVLSNIVEIELSSAPLLRVAAYRLQEAQLFDTAIMLFEEVLKMREEEPQSYRDLALVLAEKAKSANDRELYLEALTLLKKVILNKWERFNEIELIALNEYNSIRQKIPNDKSLIIHPKLTEHFQDDLRITLSWDADLVDIDLWVIEPSAEKAYYSHNRTRIGGRVSRDFTQGYGPEVYTVRKAMAGEYKIKCNFYGSRAVSLMGGVTLKVDIYTHYGTAKEKHQVISVRLNEKKEIVNLGEILIKEEFGK